MRAIVFLATLAGVAGLAAVVALCAGPSGAAPGAQVVNGTKPSADLLPLSHVVLFSSGVGYYQREGEIDGSARVDLNFDTTGFVVVDFRDIPGRNVVALIDDDDVVARRPGRDRSCRR